MSLQRHGEKHRVEVKSLDQVLLKLPAVRETFNGCRSVFKATDKDGDGLIQLAEFKQSALNMQLHLPDQLLEDVYNQADLNNSHTIDFREFIVLLTLVWLLRPQSGGEQPLAGLDKAMDTVVAAFLWFDKDNSGSIEREEVLQALGAEDVASSRAPHHSGGRHGPGRSASKHRFQEMNLLKDGKVTFPEFVLCVESWAGVEDDE